MYLAELECLNDEENLDTDSISKDINNYTDDEIYDEDDDKDGIVTVTM